MSQSYLLVRLRPVDPYVPGRRRYTVLKREGIPTTIRFEEVKGWHKVPRAIGEVLRNEEDRPGNPVFDVCTHEEAIKVEAAEEARRNAKAIRAKASNPHQVEITTAKSARDLMMDEPAPRPQPRRPAPAQAASPTPKAPPTPVDIVTPDSVDWNAVEEDVKHPADEIGDERDDGDSDEVMELETVSVASPDADEPPAAEPARKGGRRKK